MHNWFHKFFLSRFIACENGHVSVGKWLFAVGTAADSSNAQDGSAPVRDRFRQAGCQGRAARTCQAADGDGDLNDMNEDADLRKQGITMMTVAMMVYNFVRRGSS